MLRNVFGARLLAALSAAALLVLAGAASAETLPIGENVRGSISDPGGEDSYTMRVTSGGDYVITVDRRGNSRLDPMVSVYRGSNRLGGDDDGGEGLNSRLVINLSAGRYRVVVNAVGSSQGAYTIRAQRQSGSSGGGSSSSGSARTVRRGSINTGQSRSGSLRSNEVHEYSFRPSSSGTIVITANKSGSSTLDPKVTLMRGSTQVGMDDDGGGDRNARLQVSVNGGTSYKVLVSGFGTTSGSYRLNIESQGGGGGSSSSDENVNDRGSIRVGQTRTGNLAGNEVHEYTFRSNASQTVVITANKISSTLDPKVALLRNGNQIAIDDDGGGDRNARLEQSISRGTYTIRVSTFGSTSGRYRLRIEGAEDTDYTGTLSFGSSQTGSLGQNEEHSYRFNVSSSGEVSITANKASGSSLDPRVALINSDGEQIGFNDDGGGDRNALLTAELDRGTYTVVVSGFGTTSGRYVLRAERGASSASRGSLSIGSSRSGNLSAGETDSYRLTVSSGTTLRIDVEKGSGSTLDPKVTLRNSGGTQVGYDDDGGEGNNARLVSTVEEGTYTVLVQGFGQTSGSYRISVEEESFVEQGSISLGETMDGYIEAGEMHRFAFYSRSSGEVTIRVNNNGSSLDPKVAVQDADGATIGTDDDGGGNRNSLLRVNVRRGRYYIIVQAFGSTSGEYTVSVE